ncbi:MAG: DUF4345 family protein [Caldimonas sp.]
MKPSLKYRIVLTLNALSLLGFGIAFLVSPRAMTGDFGITLNGTDAVADVCAVYGGFEIGLALFLLWTVRNTAWLKAGLMAATLSLCGFMCGRIFGIVSEGHPTSATFRLLAVDVAGALLNSVFLFLFLRAEKRAAGTSR